MTRFPVFHAIMRGGTPPPFEHSPANSAITLLCEQSNNVSHRLWSVFVHHHCWPLLLITGNIRLVLSMPRGVLQSTLDHQGHVVPPWPKDYHPRRNTHHQPYLHYAEYRAVSYFLLSSHPPHSCPTKFAYVLLYSPCLIGKKLFTMQDKLVNNNHTFLNKTSLSQ